MTESSNFDVEEEKRYRSGGREIEEGERIKKVRIPKLEQQFGEKTARLQQTYISDLQKRIKNIDQDIKDLTKLAKKHKDDEEMVKFIGKKRENLKKEKKDLLDKIDEVKSDKDTLADTEVKKEKEEKSDTQEDREEEKRTNTQSAPSSAEDNAGSTLAKIGLLVLIIGLIVLLVLSFLQPF